MKKLVITIDKGSIREGISTTKAKWHELLSRFPVQVRVVGGSAPKVKKSKAAAYVPSDHDCQEIPKV